MTIASTTSIAKDPPGLTEDDPLQDAWSIAISRIADATSQPIEFVNVFLNSPHGRRFADTVQDGRHHGQALEAAIDLAIKKWMDWKIDRMAHRKYGIPRGFPYLTGFVFYCAAFMFETETTLSAV